MMGRAVSGRRPDERLTPDLCVVGAGAGAAALAMGAAAAGASVVLLLRRDEDPSAPAASSVALRSLAGAARLARAVRDGARLGLPRVELPLVWADLRAAAQAAGASAAPVLSESRIRALNVTVVRAHARFVSPSRMEGEGVAIEARRFVLAAGAAPKASRLPGLDEASHLTPEDALAELAGAPRRVAIIGGDAAAVVWSQTLARLGADVRLVAPHGVLSDYEPELVAPLLGALRRDGVKLSEAADGLRFEAGARGGARVVLGDAARDTLQETFDVDRLLVAAGRAPAVHDLGLDRAGIVHDETGVAVGPDLRTANRRVYAIGEVIRGGRAEWADRQAELVARAVLLRLRVRFDPSTAPRTVFSDPELAVAGLDEEAARAAVGSIRLHRWTFADTAAGRARKLAHGHVKIVSAVNGKVLGAGLVGPDASDLLVPWLAAIEQGAKVSDLAAATIPWGAASEVSKRAALLHYAERLRSPTLQSLLRILRRFG